MSIKQEVSINVAVVVYAIIAGSAFLFTKQASNTIPAATLAAFRLCLGSFGLITTYSFTWGFQSTYNSFRYELFGSIERSKKIVLVGMMNTVVPYTLYAVASENGVDVSVMAIMSGLSPIFAGFLSYVYISEHGSLFRPMKLIGLFIVVLGSGLVTLHEEIITGKMSESSAIGIISQLIAVICKASAAVLAEYTFRYTSINKASTHFIDDLKNEVPMINQMDSKTKEMRISPPCFAMGQAVVGALVAIPLAFIWDFVLLPSRSNRSILSNSFNWPAVIVPILYLGLISSCLVYYLQFYVLQKAGGFRQIVTVDSLTPVVGVIEGALFQCDFCHISHNSMILSICGASLCICGVALFQYDSYLVALESQYLSPSSSPTHSFHGLQTGSDENTTMFEHQNKISSSPLLGRQ